MFCQRVDRLSRFAGSWGVLRCGPALFCLWVSAVDTARAQPTIGRELRSALTALPHAETVVGACVVNLSSGVTVYEQNADVPLVPASNMKIFAMAAALVELGPDFSFETILATDGLNLFVVGGGDPAFGDEKLCRARGESITAEFQRWAPAISAAGFGEVPSDIVIDESIFEARWTHPSWEEADLDNWYAAGVSGLNFNDNCVDITVSPAGTDNAPVLVSVVPETSLAKIINKCRSGGNGTPLLHHPYDSFEYRISGRCKKRWSFGSVAFPDPGLLFADSLRAALAKKGIKVSGGIRRSRVRRPDGTLPESLSVLARHVTPLVDVLRRAGKDSQNLFAECLLKRTGYEWARRSGVANPQGGWANGAEAAQDMLRRAGIDTTGLVVADGSGLARTNRCTARQLASILAWMHGRTEADLLRDSLSIAGVDGSLRKRLTDMPGVVRGKTGTMRGIRTLCGYVEGGSNGPFAFAVLFNGYQGPSTPYKKIQDRICRILAG